MLASISPLGQRARPGRWWRAAGSFFLAATVAGAAVGALLGAVGELAGLHDLARRPVGLTLLALAAIAGAALDLTGRQLGWRRQVDESWLTRYREWVYGIGYGAQLGVGGVTIISSAATVLAGVFAIALADPTWSAALGAVFGAARGAQLGVVARVRTPADLGRVMSRFDAARAPARRVAISAQLATAIATAGVALAGLR